MKFDCPVCGQDVFGKAVVRVQGARREVTTVGVCRQCGNTVRRREVYVAGKRVNGETVALSQRSQRSRRVRR